MVEQTPAVIAEPLAQGVVPETSRQAALAKRKEKSWRTFLGRILCVVAPLIIWFAPFNLEPNAKHALAIASFMITAWITEAMAQWRQSRVWRVALLIW